MSICSLKKRNAPFTDGAFLVDKGGEDQVPIRPPSSLVMTSVAERGTVPS